MSCKMKGGNYFRNKSGHNTTLSLCSTKNGCLEHKSSNSEARHTVVIRKGTPYKGGQTRKYSECVKKVASEGAKEPSLDPMKSQSNLQGSNVCGTLHKGLKNN